MSSHFRFLLLSLTYYFRSCLRIYRNVYGTPIRNNAFKDAIICNFQRSFRISLAHTFHSANDHFAALVVCLDMVYTSLAIVDAEAMQKIEYVL